MRTEGPARALLALSALVAVTALGADRDVDAFLSSEVARPVPAWPSGAVTSTEPRLGVPTFFWATPVSGRRTPRAQGLSAVEAARQHLLEHAPLYRGAPAQWASAVVTHVHDTGQGAVIVAFEQRVQGVRVFRDEVKVVMDRELSLVALSGYLTPELSPRGRFALTAASAVAAAWQADTGTLSDAVESSAPAGDDGWLEWRQDGRRARARPVWFPLADGLMPAFSIELESSDGSRAWVISADDGAPLFRKDLAARHSYLVWADPATKLPMPSVYGPDSLPYPGSAPGAFVPTYVSQQLVTLDHAGLSTGDPWLPAAATQTSGNNVRAYADQSWPDGFTPASDLIGNVTSPGAFAFPHDPSRTDVADDTQRLASVVQLFYVTNFLHDWLYDAGFDELAGNAQHDNYRRGGGAFDELRAEALDYSGWDNANMTTPADGWSPRMQMYRWSWHPSGVRSSALDATVVAHEFAHMVSNRLIGNAIGIDSHQAYGLGEGWSDFLAALLLATADDAQVSTNLSWGGAYVIAGYSEQEPYWGIRRYPLSADATVNPLTFQHIARLSRLPSSPAHGPAYGANDEVHNAGEVWAVMLWECYVGLLRGPRLTFTEAQDRMKRYLLASLAATPLTPTFVEARDALLAVAAAEDADDYLLFWDAFARRGLGAGATAPDRHNLENEPVTESYLVGNSLRLSDLSLHEGLPACDGDGVIDSDEGGELRVTVRNLSVTALPAGSATLTMSADEPGVSFPDGMSLPLPPLAAFEETVMTVRVALGHLLGPRTVVFTASAAGPTLYPPSTALIGQWRLNVDEQTMVAARDDFEASVPVWTAGADTQLNTTNEFRLVELTPTQHVWAAAPGQSAADVWLSSPPLEVGPGPLTMTFLHRYELERDTTAAYDGAVLELSTDDGATWQDIGGFASPGYGDVVSTAGPSANPLAGRRAFIGRSERFPELRLETVSLGTQYAGKTVRVRFRLGSDDLVRLPSHGWEIDDVRFTGLVDTPFPQVVADPNTCSNQPPVATVGPPLTVDEGARVVLEGTATDVDGDPVTLTWSQVAGPTAVLTGNVFIAPVVSADQDIGLVLTANDGRVDSAPAALLVHVKNVNHTPTVTVPGARQVNAGERVTLTASASDADGDALAFTWTQVSGPGVVLSGADTATVAFDAPAATTEAQTVRLSVVVTDGVDASAPAEVSVTVAATPATVMETPKPATGCGCQAGGDWAALALAAWALVVRGRGAARRRGATASRSSK